MTPTTTPAKLALDYSTINPDRLGKRYVKPPTYHLSDSIGSGCAGDPPGFPSYFIRSVYTQYGNNPPEKSVQSVMEYNGEPYTFNYARMGALYRPLPIDHPRVQAWILHVFQHHRHCYFDPERPEGDRQSGLLIYPIPAYKLKRLPEAPEGTVIVPGGELDMRRRLAVLENEREEERGARLATVDNHSAVVIVRAFYPDFVPDPALIENPGVSFQADWWERYATHPTEDNCPGLGWGDYRRHAEAMAKFLHCRLCGQQSPDRNVGPEVR